MMINRTQFASDKDASDTSAERSSANTKKMEGHSTENDLPNQGVHLPVEPNLYADLGDAISLNLVLNTLAGPSDSLPPWQGARAILSSAHSSASKFQFTSSG